MGFAERQKHTCSVAVTFLSSILFLGLISCNTFHKGLKVNNNVGNDSLLFSLDTVAVDTNEIVLTKYILPSLLEKADSVLLYVLKTPQEISTDTLNTDAIIGFPIKGTRTKIEDSQLKILEFLLSDDEMLVEDYYPVKQPFLPNIVIHVITQGRLAYLLFSVGTEEVAITDNQDIYQVYQIAEMRLIKKWMDRVLTDE